MDFQCNHGETLRNISIVHDPWLASRLEAIALGLPYYDPWLSLPCLDPLNAPEKSRKGSSEFGFEGLSHEKAIFYK